MIRKLLLILIVTGFFIRVSQAQAIVKTSDLFSRSDSVGYTGQLIIIQDPAIDTLLSRYILMNMKLYEVNDHFGMEGIRIQIYASNKRNAREESNATMAKFLSKFPDIKTYQQYADPGYFKIRVGDFRTRTEAVKLFLLISKEFPDSYLVPDIIKFPELNPK